MITTDKRIFTDVFGDIVTDVRTDFDTVNTPKVKPYYIFGHTLAIQKELLEKTIQSRYPLVILGIDSEYQETDLSDNQYEVSFNCWIVDETKKEWLTSDRFEQVYKTVLFPIYELIKEKMLYSGYFGNFGIQDLKPQVRLYPYWGNSSNESVLTDPLDAICVKFNNLIIGNI
jgi:hypothetical protein